ncbi:hypothetical protein ABIB27_001408 [Arthrobacter sp. UYEF21]
MTAAKHENHNHAVTPAHERNQPEEFVHTPWAGWY